MIVAKLRVALLPGVAAGAVTFFLFGGAVALRDRAVFGLLPGPDVVDGLAHGLVHGWKDLLTTLPPAGHAGDLLTIPYVCGFACAAISIVLALRVMQIPICWLPPMILLVVSVLFGVRRPASLLLQGALFGGLTIAWASVRHRRHREVGATVSTVGSRQRAALAGVLLVVACFGGMVIGPHLPGAAANDRFVLRDEVEPPFDPLKEPSALAGYRNYTDPGKRDDEITHRPGPPEGRTAADRSHGRLRRSRVAIDRVGLRVGWRVPAGRRNAAHGRPRQPHEVKVQIHRPHGVWVPLAGDVRSLDFTGPARR